MWKQFWKKAPLLGLLIITVVLALGLDMAMGTEYLLKNPFKANAQNEASEPSSSIPEEAREDSENHSLPNEGNESSSASENAHRTDSDTVNQIDRESASSDGNSSGSSSSESTSAQTSSPEDSSEEINSGSIHGSETSDGSESGSSESSEESSESSESSQNSEASKPSEDSEESSPEKEEKEDSNEEEQAQFSDYTPFAWVERDPAPPLSNYYDDPGRRALDTPFDYQTVGDDYFEDALFIGDSRIEGLALYGNFNAASFLYMHGVTIFSLENDQDLVYKEHGVVISTEANEEMVLSQHQFGKIYIMLGINEIGIGDQKYFVENYKEVVDRIRSYQPDAIIVVMGILGVTEEYAEGQTVSNNDNVNSRNYQLAQLADGKTIFYLDCNPPICDPDTWALLPEYSSDGVHLRAEYYYLWRDYLYTKGIVLDSEE